MAFDADAYLKTITPPSLVVNGTTYTGHLVSFNDAIVIQDKLGKWDTYDNNQMIDVVTQVCTTIGIPSDVVLSLPPAVVYAALTDFFVSLLGTTEPSK